MSLLTQKKLSNIYWIEDGIIYYRSAGYGIFNREVCPEVYNLVTKKRKLHIQGEWRYMTYLLEAEMRSVNNYIAGFDKVFTKIKPYKNDKPRAIGDISIKFNGKEIR